MSGRERLSRLALALLGLALCGLLFYGALELGSDRSRDDGGAARKIVGLGSIPSPGLLRPTGAGAGNPRDEGVSKPGEGTNEDSVGAGEEGETATIEDEEEVPAPNETPESPDTSGSGGESKETLPKEDPPLEITPGR